ncbi:MAG TPA: glycine oxidase ThiO [Jatrophihabitans sp.]|jgi:glycine oxidase|uniref:glycine oxidase ThiO n=1 Tax=Jatrophihabitans sp. TaxID=1932789 RepID=UPI002F07A76E
MAAHRGDALLVGGGAIGLAAAYRLAERGVTVRVVDASSGRNASWAAAGMLAPVSEAAFGEDELTRLNLAAVPAFGRLATELQERTGQPVGLRTEGTLAVAFNADDRAALDRLTEFRRGLGLGAERLSGAAARALEPYLATGVRGGVLTADDLSVDNRRYLTVLRSAAEAAGVRFVTAEVSGLLWGSAGDRVNGVRTSAGAELRAGVVVLCGGAATGSLLQVPVQPVKGQILRLAVPERLRSAGPVLTRTVRGIVRGSEIYLVPRSDGEVVVGATSEQQGHDTGVTAGGVYELLRNAYELLPISSEFGFVEARAGSRPGTPDNGPILGQVCDGLVLATGHYRNGILLSALTAEAVAALVDGEPVAPVWRPFPPDRFAGYRPPQRPTATEPATEPATADPVPAGLTNWEPACRSR